MNTPAITLPEIPAPPQGATWDQQMRYIEGLYAAVRATQAEHHILATRELARVQDLARQVAERQVEQAMRLADLMAQPPAPSAPPPAAPEAPMVPYQLRLQAMVDLVSSMTSTQRGNPVAAAEAAANQLGAINARL